MIKASGFIIGAIIFVLAILGIGHAMADAELNAMEEADRWEEEHSKDRDGSNV